MVAKPQVFVSLSHRVDAWHRALRLHQWAKNTLVFAPLIAAHHYLDTHAITATILAFVAFSLCASAAYIVNDLCDIEADRLHPRKRHRPFAAGELSVRAGITAAVSLLFAAIAIALFLLPLGFTGLLTCYFILTLWYSLRLKRKAIVDVLSLAGLYTLRILAGSAATNISPSFWLLALSMFLFLSLASAKRYVELRGLQQDGAPVAGRGYTTSDLPLVLAFGVAAGFMAVLVVALYVQSDAASLYAYPYALWVVCPILLYWTSRIWLKAFRGQLHDDPVVFAMTDRPSLIAFVLMLTAVAAAS